MRRWSIVAVALVLAVALAIPATLSVVGQTPTPSPTSAANQAMLRAVNTVPDGGPLDVTSGGSSLFCNLPFKTVTRYAAVPAGSLNLTIAPASAPATSTGAMTPTAGATTPMTGAETMTPSAGATGALTPTTGTESMTPSAGATGAMTATTAVTVMPSTPQPVAGGVSAAESLAAGQAYSLVVVGSSGSTQTLLLTDDLSAPPAGSAKVRFVHASPDAPAVDVAVSGGQSLFSNVGFQSASGYAPVDAGTMNLEVRGAGTSNVVLTLPNVTLNDGTVYTIYAVGLANGQPALQALVSVESVGGVPVPANPLS